MLYNVTQSFIPVQLQTVALFSAPDPWNGNAPTQWTLSVYRMTAEQNRQLYATYSAEKQLETTNGQNLDAEDVLGIRSSVDGLYHILPIALVRLWQQDRVPNTALPELIAAFEARLERRDFFDVSLRQRWRRNLVYGILVVGCLFALGALWLSVSAFSDGGHSVIGPTFLLVLALIYWAIGGVVLFFFNKRQRRVDTLQAEIAALLPATGNPFPNAEARL